MAEFLDGLLGAAGAPAGEPARSVPSRCSSPAAQHLDQQQQDPDDVEMEEGAQHVAQATPHMSDDPSEATSTRVQLARGSVPGGSCCYAYSSPLDAMVMELWGPHVGATRDAASAPLVLRLDASHVRQPLALHQVVLVVWESPPGLVVDATTHPMASGGGTASPRAVLCPGAAPEAMTLEEVERCASASSAAPPMGRPAQGRRSSPLHADAPSPPSPHPAPGWPGEERDSEEEEEHSVAARPCTLFRDVPRSPAAPHTRCCAHRPVPATPGDCQAGEPAPRTGGPREVHPLAGPPHAVAGAAPADEGLACPQWPRAALPASAFVGRSAQQTWALLCGQAAQPPL